MGERGGCCINTEISEISFANTHGHDFNYMEVIRIDKAATKDATERDNRGSRLKFIIISYAVWTLINQRLR